MGPHANDRVQVRRVFETNNAPEPGRWMAETCCSWQERGMAAPSAIGASMSRATTNVHADSARSIVAAMGREGVRRSPVQSSPFETEEYLIRMLARVLR